MVAQIIALPQKKNSTGGLEFLLILALCVDLFTPYLIWKGLLPPLIRWGSHVAVALMILISLLRMLAFDYIPRSFWCIAAVSVIGAFVAIGHGQGIPATIWGVWLLFQFPFVGLFFYLQSDWPRDFPRILRTLALWILGLQVFIQLLQYGTGVNPGDDLSGLFGKNGTGNAALFDILVCCLFFGHWIASRQWKGLLIALCLGMLSSVLGEMKLFPAAITTIGLLSAFLFSAKYRTPGKMFAYLILIFLTMVSFTLLYNVLIPSAEESPLQAYVIDPTRLLTYINRVESFTRGESVYTDIGRGYAVKFGWDSLQHDALTLLFGYGLGTRSESQSLGMAGVALKNSSLGLSVGTSLLVMMQEMGVIGLAALAGLILWIISSLRRDIRNDPDSPVLGMRYAILLFSALWPLWLWYAVTWTMRVPMLLYWFFLGYVFAEARREHRQMQAGSYRTMVTGG